MKHTGDRPTDFNHCGLCLKTVLVKKSYGGKITEHRGPQMGVRISQGDWVIVNLPPALSSKKSPVYRYTP